MTTVEAILTRKGSDVCSINPSDTVLDAACIMNERGIGGLVVVEGGRIVGMFTERDILRRVVARRLDPASTAVRDVMTSRVAACRIDTTLDECQHLMTRNRIRHLPVVNGTDVIGIVTIGDVLAQGVVEQGTTIEFLNDYICGGPSRDIGEPPA